MNDILIPSEVMQAYFDDDAAIIIVSPPQGLPSHMWRQWAEDAIALDVADVQPITEQGRTLVRITLGAALTNKGTSPKEFHIVEPLVQDVTLSINLGVSTSQRGYAPTVTTVGALPQSTPTTAVEAPRCTRPVRVWPSTHSKLKAYSRQTGLNIAAIIGKAVDRLCATQQG